MMWEEPEIIIQLPGVTIRSGGDFGYILGPEGMTGWHGGVSLKSGAASIDGRTGAPDLQRYLETRLVDIPLLIKARSRHHAAHMGQVLEGLGALGHSVPITVTDWLGTTSGLAHFRTVPSWAMRIAVAKADASIELEMPDPLKYGPEEVPSVSSGEPAFATNAGNFWATPRVRIDGPFAAGYRIHGAGRVFEVPSALPEGVIDRVDFANGVVLRSGRPLIGVAGLRQTFLVPGGAEKFEWRVEAIGAGGGQVTARVRATYA